MSEQTDPETLKYWHRTFAKQCNNTAWDLAARETRTPVDDHTCSARLSRPRTIGLS